MADGEPTIEEVLFRQFRGWEPHNIPPDDLLPRLVGEGQLIDARGVITETDGVIRWKRDQFRISETGRGGNLLDIFEYKTGSHNQLLAFCSDQKLYTLETDWPAATPVQFAYGYQLDWDDPGNGNYAFSEAADSLQASGRHGFAAAKDVLLVGHREQATKRWNGAALTDVGFLPPPNAPTTPSGADEKFLTDYTETEEGAEDYLTLTDARITAAAMPRTATGRVSKDFTAGYFNNFVHTFEAKLTAVDVSGRMGLWGVCNVADETYPSWQADDYMVLIAGRTAEYYSVQMYTSLEVSIPCVISVNTSYYFTIKREGAQVTLYVYTDSDRSTLIFVDTISCPGGAFRYLYGISANETAGAETISGYIDGLNINEAGLGSGKLTVGNYSYCYTYGNAEWESMPSPIANVTVSVADKSITISNLNVGPAGTTWRRLYRSYTSSTAEGVYGDSYGLLVQVDTQDADENDITTYTDEVLPAYIGEPPAFDHAIPPRGDLLVHHNDRAFMAHCSCSSRSYDDYETSGLDNMLFWSELAEPYYWPGQNYARVGDSSPIMALVSWRGWLFIFKETSVWVLRGYTEDQFVLEQLTNEFGISNYNAAAAGPPGVVWRDKGGLMFTDGSNVRVLRDYDIMSVDPPVSTVTHPTIAYHRQKFYILEGDYLLTWDPVRDSWAYEYFNETTVGIRAFNFGRYQSHLLSYWEWNGGHTYIGVKDTGQQFTYYDAQGVSESNAYFAPVQITLPALIARPGEEIVPLEVWIDGSWVAHGTEGRRPYIFLNDDADYSTVAGQNVWETTPLAPKDGDVIGVLSGYSYGVGGVSKKTNAFRELYIQIKATEAEDFVLNAVGLRFYRRAARG